MFTPNSGHMTCHHSSPSPSVPYIGPFLSQLISIEVGMPTFVKDPPEHINFAKLSKVQPCGSMQPVIYFMQHT